MTTSLSASAPASGVGFPRRRARLGLAAALVAATAVAAPQAGQPVRAETFVVTSADAGLVDPVDGSLLTLAGAVAGASDGDVITFSPSLTGFTIDAVNVPDITVDLTIDGLSGPRLTNTNGDVFTVDDPAAAVTFRNLSILDPVTGGSTPSSAFVAIDAESVEIVNAFARAVDHGARIDEADTVTITSFRVLDGAAVSISDTQDVDIDLGEFHRAPDDVGVRLENVATAEITNTELDANGSGGIVASEVDDLSLVDVDILDSGMNPGGGSATGGLEITAAGGASLVSVVDSAIAGNVGAGGGGITATGDVRLTLERSFVSANDGVDAEAIAASLTAAGATLTIVDTRIALHVDGATPTDPAPVVAVGGIGGTGDTTILRSTISGSAGTRVIEATGTTVAVSESTVTGNELTQSVIGAGPDATFDIQRSTISANESGGPAILDITSTPTTGTITVSDSIVTANGVTPLEQAVDPGAGVTVTHSLVPAASGVIGTGVVATDDPGLVNTGDNGGPTVTMLPGPDSPAVDAGDPAVALPPNATDQRGAARLVGDRIDMGSVERQESVFVETVEPARLLDTRDGENTVDGLFNGIGRRTDGQTTELQATGRAGVPTDALAVVVNVTAVGPDTVGFITVEP
ncbi:MAG: choice-of-anchor Q domain-containing protein, partial [Actinomycetota bacterium]